MRRPALILVPLLLLACGRDPAAPVGALAAHDEHHDGGVVIHKATGSWDIYVYDVKSRTTTQASTIAGADEWNAAFSPDGRSIVHEVIGAHDLYITRITTGVSRPLAGGEGGNDADWSPNGWFIAFDGDWGDPNLYVVPAVGGTRRLVRAVAMDPEWAPDSHHLVFRDHTDWSVRTIDLRSGSEHRVAEFGLNPAWSTDGRHIAYSDGFNIFSIAVDRDGAAVGVPVQVTSDPYGLYTNQEPSWSSDGRTIVFSSNRSGTDFDVWVVPAAGGTPTRLFGTVGEGDYDPSIYGNRLVAFSKFTPIP
jgi:Tol biopolymer transport system component